MLTTWRGLLLLSLAAELVAGGSDLLLQTPVGRIRGFYQTASYGRTYRAFEGIPYGKPPINDLRFEGFVPGTVPSGTSIPKAVPDGTSFPGTVPRLVPGGTTVARTFPDEHYVLEMFPGTTSQNLIFIWSSSWNGSCKWNNSGTVTTLGTVRGIALSPGVVPGTGTSHIYPPQPYGPWNGTLLATQPSSTCMQYPDLTTTPDDRVIGAEDCLYLNIYAPRFNKKMTPLLPVFFWIHGGSYQFGSGYEQGSAYIMNRDVIYVNMNYRLGPLGFMSTEDEVVPGNMGLKDQSLALHWVHDNIASFGGDPKRITVGGISAGASSAHYHLLSPMSRHLLQGGMAFSGTVLDAWAQIKHSGEKAKKLASILGCPTNNNRDMIKCLKLRPGRNIMQQVGKFQPWLYTPDGPFGPVVETNSSKPFVDKPPVDIIASGEVADIPWITSVVSEEGLYPAAEFVERKDRLADLDKNWNTILPHLLDYNFTVPLEKHGEVAQAIRAHYLGNKTVESKNGLALIHMIGDRLYAVDALKSAKLMAKANRSPVWFYYYSHSSPWSLAYLFGATQNWGVSHSDDVNLITGPKGFPNVTDKPTLEVQNILLDIVETFMKTGRPKTKIYWPKVNPSTRVLEYLHISGPNTLKAVSHENFAETKFWSSIGFQENIITVRPVWKTK